MLRGGPQVSAQDNKQQQQKQKKRLCFKDPEVEGPLRNYIYTGCNSKTLTKPTNSTKATSLRKTSASVEDLTLEDQALQIAQNVGNAFSDLSITDNEQIDFSGFESFSADFEAQKETEIRDSSPTDFESYQRNCQLRNFKISTEDQEFLDDLVPSFQEATMRGPSAESGDPNFLKNCIPAEPSLHEGRPSSSTQHQIQMLRYQLEQQNQQTQMALHQVQLLQDQMDAESTARRKAQEQNNQLMQQNKELLSHMEKLFQQIEEFERQILTLEQEKRGKRVTANTESQVISSLRKPTTWAARRPSNELVNEKPTRWAASQRQSSEQVNEKPTRWAASQRQSSEQVNEKPSTWSTGRRPSNEQVSEKPTLQNRSQLTTTKKNTPTSTKPLGATPKTPSTQNSSSTLSTRKTPSISSKPLAFQSKSKDSATKEKETLRIGDTSPTVQSGTTSPFSSNWKLKAPDTSSGQSNTEKALGNSFRNRTGSFSSFAQRSQEGDTVKSSLFSSSNSSLSTTSITGKKYSSSTSDLYNTSSAIQGKSSLMIEEPSTSVKSAISNLNISTSKLPRYQPYVGWRRASLTNENEPVSAISKDSYKTPTKTSLFNR